MSASRPEAHWQKSWTTTYGRATTRVLCGLGAASSASCKLTRHAVPLATESLHSPAPPLTGRFPRTSKGPGFRALDPSRPCLKRMAETCWQNPQAVTIRWVMLSLRSYSCLESCDNVASCVEDSCGCNEQRYCSILRIFRDLTPRPGLYNRKLNEAEVRSQQSIGHNLVGKAKILS